MRTTSKIVPLLFALAIIGAACGNSETSNDGGSQGAPTTGATSEPEATGGGETTPEGEDLKLTAGSSNGAIPGTFFGTFFEELLPNIAERVNNETNSTLTWTTAPGGSVAKPGEELNAVKNGVLDFATVGTPYESSTIPLWQFSFSWVPFCSSHPSVSIEAADQVVNEMSDVFLDDLESNWNQKYFGFGALTNYELVTTFQAQNMDDLKGHKIASALTQWFEGTGATAVSSTWPEAYQSMQTGVYDGFLIAPDTAGGSRAYEVAPYVTEGLNPLAPVVSFFSMNLDTWNSLPSDVQAIFEDEMETYVEDSAQLADAAHDKGIEIYEENGGTVTPFDPDARTKWAQSMPNIPKLRAEELDDKGLPGTEVAQLYIEKLQEISGTPCERDWFGG